MSGENELFNRIYGKLDDLSEKLGEIVTKQARFEERLKSKSKDFIRLEDSHESLKKEFYDLKNRELEEKSSMEVLKKVDDKKEKDLDRKKTTKLVLLVGAISSGITFLVNYFMSKILN